MKFVILFLVACIAVTQANQVENKDPLAHPLLNGDNLDQQIVLYKSKVVKFIITALKACKPLLVLLPSSIAKPVGKIVDDIIVLLERFQANSA